MKKLEEKLAGKIPSLVAFMHAAEHDAVDVKYITEELRAIYGDKVNIIRVDSSYNRPVIRKYNLNAYPTWILFKEGQELMRESGEKTVNQLSQLIERAF
ncbi:MAG: thioredoxin family protein [Muribaculaceae bacterium]|nr:thioredoxin family protein [Muribaculaceae bacterium]